MIILDLLALGAVSLVHFGITIPVLILYYSAGYFFLKLFLFRDVMSGIDAVFGGYILLVAFFHVSSFFYYFMLGWFMYKLIFTIVNL